MAFERSVAGLSPLGHKTDAYCNIAYCSVGSWAYDGNNVRLQVAEESEGLALTYYKSACPLAVDNHTAEIVSHTYPCCEETYPSMDVNLVFSKRQ